MIAGSTSLVAMGVRRMQLYRRNRKGQYVQPAFFLLTWYAQATFAAGMQTTSPPADAWSVHGLLNVILALVAVLGVFALGALLLRRYGALQHGNAGKLRIVDGLPLGARDRLVLVDVAGEQVLLGITPGNIQTLHVVGSGGVAADFRAQLQAALQRPTIEGSP